MTRIERNALYSLLILGLLLAVSVCTQYPTAVQTVDPPTQGERDRAMYTPEWTGPRIYYKTPMQPVPLWKQALVAAGCVLFPVALVIGYLVVAVLRYYFHEQGKKIADVLELYRVKEEVEDGEERASQL